MKTLLIANDPPYGRHLSKAPYLALDASEPPVGLLLEIPSGAYGPLAAPSASAWMRSRRPASRSTIGASVSAAAGSTTP